MNSLVRRGGSIGQQMLTTLLMCIFVGGTFFPLQVQSLDEKDRQFLIEGAKHQDADVRAGAFLSLGERGERQDLPHLYSALYDADYSVRKIAETAIWKVWGRYGNDEIDAVFAEGLNQMSAGRFVLALKTFTGIIERVPDFTEAWNKRATLYYLLNRDNESMSDVHEVLRQEPMHFGALTGYGLLKSRQGDYRVAIKYFEQALLVNPNMKDVAHNLEQLEKYRGRPRRGEI
ncbi:MAG: HEAT repeat domain-containing protein [Burkholderiales bacterium]|jgi:tetratricopeptide (TPR) repeat protein